MPLVAALLVGLLVLWLGVNFDKGPAYFFTISFIGLTNGAVYALVALGYTLVYGILELINFAHGDVFMLGGMISATMLISRVFDLKASAVDRRRSSPRSLVSLVVAMVACGAAQRDDRAIAYRPLRGAPRLAPLITAIGMSFILQNIAIAWKGPSYIVGPERASAAGTSSRSRGVVYTWEKLIVVHRHGARAARADVARAAARGRARRCARPRRIATPRR